MCFLIVLASRPCAIGVLAICCEYQTSDLPGLFFRKALYAFCQLAYLACVSILRASRLVGAGCVARVGGGGCVHHLVKHSMVQRETAILNADDIRQRHCICAHYQCQMPMDAQAQHLGALVATRHANGQQADFGWLYGGLLQAETGGNKSAHRLGIAAP
jgi:hypothetical protein